MYRGSVHVVSFAFCLFLALLFAAPTAAVVVACGDTLGPGGSITVDNSLDDCPASAAPALTIVGPVTVDFLGARVECVLASPPIGILVKGRNAKVMNAQVFNCRVGVKVAGSGGHEILAINADSHIENGFLVTSSKNNIHECAGNDAETGDGFLVRGKKNVLSNNVGVHNFGNGFDIEGNSNRLTSSVAAENGSDGIEIDGKRNKVLQNSSSNNRGDGIEINGDRNKLTSNTSTRNVGNGFFVKALMGSADSNTLTGNAVVENLEDGFRIAGKGNTLSDNRAFDNGSDGFVALVSSARNKIRGNLSVGHESATGTGLNDMQDNSPGCGTNIWSANLFKTSTVSGGANPGCIK